MLRSPTNSNRPWAALVVLVAAIALSSCTNAEPAELDALRAQFVAAGGSCGDWATLDEPRSLGAIECSSGAKIYVFDSDGARSDVVKTELDVNTDIRARKHIMLSGDYWLIIDRIPVIIELMPRLGGMIQGRNGANP